MKISFVIPTFNCVTWLPHAVSSCLTQKYNDIEVIVVDDGSTDYTQQYLKSLANDKRVVVIKNSKNMGRSSSRNIGNETAKGEVICVLDADDIAEPKRALITAEKFKDDKLKFLYGSAKVVNCTDSMLFEIRAEPFILNDAVKEKMNKIVHSTVAYRKDFAKMYYYLDGDVSRLGIDDWEQQLRAAIDGVKLEMTPTILSSYRLLDSQTVKKRDEKEVLKLKEEIISKAFKVPIDR